MTSTTIRRLAATCCALTIGVVAVGCGGETSGGETTVVVTATTTTAAALTLEQRAITAADFDAFPIDGTEVVDLDDFIGAVSDGEDADGDRALLTTAGFTRGAVTRFETGDEDAYAQGFVAEVDESAASGLVDQVVAQVADVEDEPGLTATEFTVDEAGAAKGIEISGTTSDGQQVAGAQVLFADGAYVYGIQIARTGTTPVGDEARSAVTAWHGRVAGAPAAPETGTGTATGPTTTTAPTDTTAAADDFPNAGEIAVLSHVPPATADDCRRTSETARAGKATSSVTCLTDTHRVYYEEFASAADMRESYEAYLTSQAIARGEGTSCDDGAPAEGTWNGDDDRVACFVDDGNAWVVWNSTQLRLVAVAIDPEGNLQRLFDWWKGPESGPIA